MTTAGLMLMFGSSGAPYDSRVEYLESTGTQWIDTGVVPRPGDEVRLRLYRIVKGSPFGCCGDGWRRGALAIYYSEVWEGNSSFDADTPAVTLGYKNVWHDFVMDGTGVHVDGAKVGERVSTGDTPFRTMYLFGVHSHQTPDARYPETCRIASFSVRRGGEMLCDLIPARRGSAGFMYDRVAGGCLFPQGGPLIAGPDRRDG